LYVRITKNPAHYAIGPGKTSPETRLEEICLEAIKELVDSGVVDQREDELSATRASRSHPPSVCDKDSTDSRLHLAEFGDVRPPLASSSEARPAG